MTIPNYQKFMLPVLKMASKETVYISDVVARLADEMNISEEDRNAKISNGSSLLYGRISWAKAYLLQAGLLQSMGRGAFVATAEGQELLKKNLNEINNKTLENYESFNKFKKRSNKKEIKPVEEALSEISPEEAIDQAVSVLNQNISSELLARIIASKPIFFERLTCKLLQAMGYGSNEENASLHTGKSGDDGVDGIISQDVLGVDKIYIQAKRYNYNNSVGSQDIRNFIGSLNIHRATKGIFMTTSQFTESAKRTAKESTNNIVLIDGAILTDLMIKYNVGCKDYSVIKLKKISDDFFDENQ